MKMSLCVIHSWEKWQCSHAPCILLYSNDVAVFFFLVTNTYIHWVGLLSFFISDISQFSTKLYMCLVISTVAYPSLRFLSAIIYHLLLALTLSLFLWFSFSFRFSRHIERAHIHKHTQTHRNMYIQLHTIDPHILEPLADALHSFVDNSDFICTLSKCLRSRTS